MTRSRRAGSITVLLLTAYLLFYAGCVLLLAVLLGLTPLPGLVCVFAGQVLGVIAWLRWRAAVRRGEPGASPRARRRGRR